VRVPDAIEPLVGYREWHAWTGVDGKPILLSLYRPSIWPYAEPMSAKCLKNDLGLWMREPVGEHRSPDPACQCGVYAHRHPQFEPCSTATPHRYVSGVVIGWGRYILGTKGWRTEVARPVALLASPGTDAWVEQAADLYRVDVIRKWSELRLAA
jgi:hypothetical protein